MMFQIPGGTMNTRQNNLTEMNQQDICIDEQVLSACSDMELANAETLLDQIEAAQLQTQDLQDDISLLQTTENALDLISENLAKVKRLVTEKQNCSADHATTVALNDEIRNLLMINLLIAEDTERNGRYLFRDDIIPMTGCGDSELTLTTTRIPEIAGIDNNDIQATMDSLDMAARTINRQYQRIGSLMRQLLKDYQQLLNEASLLMTIQGSNLQQKD